MHLPPSFLQNRRLETLVENQTSYTLQHAEMHVFETHKQAEQVLLAFRQPVLATMLEGKKIMHLQGQGCFDFLPGESLILPANEMMCIDFPEAREQSPTRCLAMTIAEEKVREVVEFLNEEMPKNDGAGEWRFTDYNFHFTHDLAVHGIIQRLLFLFTEDHPSKDLFADFMIKELVIRILQAETRKIYSDVHTAPASSNRLQQAIHYIREHLDHTLTIKDLSAQVYMSESHFQRVFKNELGISPISFINEERIKLATRLLNDPTMRIKDVCMACGFNSLSHFNRLFKRRHQLSPREYQTRQQYGQAAAS